VRTDIRLCASSTNKPSFKNLQERSAAQA